MKGPDTQQNNQDPPVLHRNIQTMARQILATQYMTTNTDYYLRIKQILDNNKAQFLFDYMELVPKSVYDMDEDKH